LKNLKKVCEKIKAAHEIAIGCHINPDGDTIGSLLSLGLGLRQMGKKVHLLSQDGVPKRYRALPGARGIRRSFRGKVDLAISVDCGTKELLGKVYRTFERAGYVIEIDHHPVRRAFGDLSLVDPQAPCVGEVIERVLERLGVRIDSDMAENILTSIIVETDSFRMPGLKPSSFDLCARLMRKGVDYYSLYACRDAFSRRAAGLSGRW
jgi:phosphoesterase RecJ-like protein